MIDLQVVIDRAALTGYTVSAVKAKEPDLQNVTDLPLVFVGYTSVDAKDPTALKATLNTITQFLVIYEKVQIAAQTKKSE